MLSLVGDVIGLRYGSQELPSSGRVRSGQVRFITRPKSRTMSHKVASPTSEVTSLESSFARIFQMIQQSQSQNVAENHSDVLQAANLHIRGRGDSGC